MVESSEFQEAPFQVPTLCPRMLIVDDEMDICSLLKDFFTLRGFSVTSVFSGEEALDYIASQQLDVLILDILLPGISGIEVLKRARKVRPDMRIIMITSLEDEDIRHAAEKHGAAAYITKPFDFSDKTWSEPLQGLL